MTEISDVIESIDKIVHEKARLGIMMLLYPDNRADFVYLKGALALTDGNVGTHLRVLEDANYIKVEKKYKGRKPQTIYQLTEQGKRAYDQYTEVLNDLISIKREKDYLSADFKKVLLEKGKPKEVV
jgi:Transcriptional regulator PadR-like family.